MNAPKKYRLFIMAKNHFAESIEFASVATAQAFVEAFKESLEFANLWKRLPREEARRSKLNFTCIGLYDEKGWEFFER